MVLKENSSSKSPTSKSPASKVTREFWRVLRGSRLTSFGIEERLRKGRVEIPKDELQVLLEFLVAREIVKREYVGTGMHRSEPHYYFTSAPYAEIRGLLKPRRSSKERGYRNN